MYSQKRNFAASVPISKNSCVCERFIYPQDCSTYFPAAEYSDRSRECTECSQTHECGNWYWGCAIPFLGAYLFRIFGIVPVQCTKPTSLSQTLPLALGTAIPPNSKGGHLHFCIWHPSLVPEHTGIELGLHIPVPNCLQHWPKKLYEGGDHILYG